MPSAVRVDKCLRKTGINAISLCYEGIRLDQSRIGRRASASGLGAPLAEPERQEGRARAFLVNRLQPIEKARFEKINASETVCNPARPGTDVTSCGAALQANGCGRQSAQSGADHHQVARRVAMGNAALVSSGQRRHLSSDRGQPCARPLLCPYPLASGIHERAAYVYDRSVLRRCLGQLVGQQRR